MSALGSPSSDSTPSQSGSKKLTDEATSSKSPEKKKEEPKGTYRNPFTKRNWDTIIKDFEKEDQEDQSAKELFQSMYEKGSDEVKRAMLKSYTESSGTILSTNWDKVKDKKVEPKPPTEYGTD